MRERNGTHTENMNEGKKQIQKNLKRKKRRDFPSIFTPFFPENQTKIHSEKNRDSKEKLENKIGERRSTRRKTIC